MQVNLFKKAAGLKRSVTVIKVLSLEKQLICAQKIHWSFAADSVPLPRNTCGKNRLEWICTKERTVRSKERVSSPLTPGMNPGKSHQVLWGNGGLPVTHPLKSLGQCWASFQAGCSAGDMAPGIMLPDAGEAELELPSYVGSFL